MKYRDPDNPNFEQYMNSPSNIKLTNFEISEIAFKLRKDVIADYISWEHAVNEVAGHPELADYVTNYEEELAKSVRVWLLVDGDIKGIPKDMREKISEIINNIENLNSKKE